MGNGKNGNSGMYYIVAVFTVAHITGCPICQGPTLSVDWVMVKPCAGRQHIPNDYDQITFHAY